MDPGANSEKAGAPPSYNSNISSPLEFISGSTFDSQLGSAQPPPPSYNQPTSQAEHNISIMTIVKSGDRGCIYPTNGHINRISLVSQFVLGPEPWQGVCPCCGQFITTQIEHKMGNAAKTWMEEIFMHGGLAGILCLWIPAVVNSGKDVLHSCPKCHYQLGRFIR